MVCSIDPTMPVIADADTGFGGPINVARTVKSYALTGVAALHIEDQVQTKRCGHLMGKQVVSREEFLTRIRAAVLARDSIPGGSDFVRSNHLTSLFYFILTNELLLGYHWTNGFSTGSGHGRSSPPTSVGC
jgi:hypothetical protein